MESTLIITFTDLNTGAVRYETWHLKSFKNKPAYQSPDGRYYTKGLIGWFDITNIW